MPRKFIYIMRVTCATSFVQNPNATPLNHSSRVRNSEWRRFIKNRMSSKRIKSGRSAAFHVISRNKTSAHFIAGSSRMQLVLLGASAATDKCVPAESDRPFYRDAPSLPPPPSRLPLCVLYRVDIGTGCTHHAWHSAPSRQFILVRGNALRTQPWDLRVRINESKH